MKLDDDFERDRAGDLPNERSERPTDPQGPLADREVPLAPIATADVIHRWLDGELPEPAGMHGDSARAVEFWRRIGDEAERRRRVVTPPHVAARIMASLPDAHVAAPRAMPWWKKDLRLSPLTALALLAGAFALG
ncbi:MAG TPA: hypothetical protein VLE53_15190, partial [Gemmatimonadaceae bacterium]|nr:hypothetical protein [Gemmatimonadaceae bacterium]